MELLPDGVLEQCLLRLPYVAIVFASQVCRKWKHVIRSQSFGRSHRGKVKLVENLCRDRNPPETVYKIIDSGNKVLRWTGRWEDLGSITAHVNGLLLKTSGDANDEDCYIGDMFTNRWEQIPTPPGGFLYLPDAAVFDLGGGQYRIVYWKTHQGEGMMTLETGQTEWSVTPSEQETCFYTNPVVIGNSVFRVHYYDGLLKEFESVSGKVSCTRITSREEEVLLDFRRDFHSLELVAWQGGLYLLIVDNDSSEPQTVEIWQVSAGDGRATFVSRFEMEWRLDWFKVTEVEQDHGLVHFQGKLRDDDGTKVSIVYNMASKAVQETSVEKTLVESMLVVAVPVRL